jgi:hypothetical protein
MTMDIKQLDLATAENIVEQLRYGVPPPDYVRLFTVGRVSQLDELEKSLSAPANNQGSALLVKANYGAGKSHLLKDVREIALDAGYAVTLVVVNSQEGVRFNRLDTILGSICQYAEVDHSGKKGIGRFFDSFAQASAYKLGTDIRDIRDRISSSGRWDHSEYLKSPAVYIALRAWIASSDSELHELIEDWLSNPANYRGQRKLLYNRLVYDLRGHFRDPRQEWQYYADEAFLFHTGGHRQAWDALADFDLIAKASGLRGLVLLFDEFEDVIQNLNRRDLQQAALINLFRFFAGDRFPGMSYFAVTPDFAAKCKKELLRRGVYEFDYRRFDALPFFELEPVTEKEFLELAGKIRLVHGIAHCWDSVKGLGTSDLRSLVRRLWAVESPERVRRAIQGVIQALDERLEVAALCI